MGAELSKEEVMNGNAYPDVDVDIRLVYIKFLFKQLPYKFKGTYITAFLVVS